MLRLLWGRHVPGLRLGAFLASALSRHRWLCTLNEAMRPLVVLKRKIECPYFFGCPLCDKDSDPLSLWAVREPRTLDDPTSRCRWGTDKGSSATSSPLVSIPSSMY